MLHPLNRFKYWPVFSVFVLVPSAHIGVHGLFPSLIISPPAALAQNGVIIQQAAPDFPSGWRPSPGFSQPCIPVALSSTASKLQEGPCSRGLSCPSESNLGSRVREALRGKKKDNNFSLLSLALSYEAGLNCSFISITQCSESQAA